MQNREPSDIRQAFDRYTHAMEQLRKVAHYYDKEVMGRAPTESEKAEFQKRNQAKQAALRRVCGWPCDSLAAVRKKGRLLFNAHRDGATLGQREINALLDTLMKVPKG